MSGNGRLMDAAAIGEWFHTHPLTACGVIDKLVALGPATAAAIVSGHSFRARLPELAT